MAACTVPFGAHAQNADTVVKGTVIDERDVSVDDTDIFGIGGFAQEIAVELTLDGQKDIVTFVNSYIELEKGSKIYVRIQEIEGETVYSLYDLNRSGILWIVVALFVGCVFLIGGKKSLRSLLSLVVSVAILFYVLLPLLANGHSPLLWGVLIAVTLLGLVMVITHGFTYKTLAAFLGTAGAVMITGILALFTVRSAAFTGLSSEEEFSLQILGTGIDMPQLLLAGIIIGMIGVLDDVAITQASVVMELKRAGISGAEIYHRAMRVGKEHIGALINTLVLAYMGASLPLFILFSTYQEPLGAILSIELVAVEIVRSLLGSIGLILAVPLTTFLATLLATDEVDEEHGHMHRH